MLLEKLSIKTSGLVFTIQNRKHIFYLILPNLQFCSNFVEVFMMRKISNDIDSLLQILLFDMIFVTMALKNDIFKEICLIFHDAFPG